MPPLLAEKGGIIPNGRNQGNQKDRERGKRKIMITVGSLFSGIGGIDLGLERAGMKIKWQVENNRWCCDVLRKNFPNATQYELDIREFPGNLNPEPIDFICGGFPCQPFSVAGKRRGEADDRYLWPEMLRVIEALRPTWVLGENVPGIVRMGLDRTLSDLETIGYACRTFSIPACALGAPHIRQRIFVLAYADRPRRKKQQREHKRSNLPPGSNKSRMGAGEDVGHTHCSGCQDLQGSEERAEQPGRGTSGYPGWWDAEPDMGRVAHGVPRRVDRLRGLGNAVVPQTAEFIGKQIVKLDGETIAETLHQKEE